MHPSLPCFLTSVICAAPTPPQPQALRILLESYGFNDARVAFALHNLGGFFLSQGRLVEAADAYEKALQVAMT